MRTILLQAARLARIINVVTGGFVAWSCFAQSPLMPTVDTNLTQVGSVNVAWNPVVDTNDLIIAYWLYAGTDTNNLAPAIEVYGGDTTNATVPLFSYGTNWISATSVDAYALESDQSAPISFNLISLPPTNVVTVSLWSSTNATAWAYAQTLFTLTNPPGKTFYRLGISNQTQ